MDKMIEKMINEAAKSAILFNEGLMIDESSIEIQDIYSGYGDWSEEEGVFKKGFIIDYTYSFYDTEEKEHCSEDRQLFVENFKCDFF